MKLQASNLPRGTIVRCAVCAHSASGEDAHEDAARPGTYLCLACTEDVLDQADNTATPKELSR